MRVLVTGAAGFIGSHVSHILLDRGDEVMGLDNLNRYYDPGLKQARLDQLMSKRNFRFVKADISNRLETEEIFVKFKPNRVINLAAQAGVRYGLENPHSYIDTNIMGFLNILEGCRHHSIENLVFASSSSVYGASTQLPFSVEQNVDHPVSLYAATKKSNELMAHCYAHLYRLPVIGLRFFTVYGPWGRPDMSLFMFTKKILSGEPIDVFNNGNHARDFTYIDDIATGVVKCVDAPAAPDPNWDGAFPRADSSSAPYRIYNIGNSKPIEVMYFIECIEKTLGKSAQKNFLSLQPGDVPSTFADISKLETDFHFTPQVQIEDGIKRFVTWYRDYYNV